VVIAIDAGGSIADRLYDAHARDPNFTEAELRLLAGEEVKDVSPERAKSLEDGRQSALRAVQSNDGDALAKAALQLGVSRVLVVVHAKDTFVHIAGVSAPKSRPGRDADTVLTLLAEALGAPPAQPKAGAPSTTSHLDLATTEPPPQPTPRFVAAQDLDLAKEEKLPTAGLPTIETLPFEAQREWIRGALALSLVSALIVTLLLFLLGDMFDHPIDGAKLNACVTALVGLVGSVTGFYFGSQSVKR
jgi:hypothetical protein